jgi:callose synthase
MTSGYEQLGSQPSSEFKHKSSEQKTFSYPDALEFNYFDPDSLPQHLQAHADIIFSTVQDLASDLGFQVDNSRNQAEHLLVLLSNECRQGEHILTEPPGRLHAKLFANYKRWCDRVGSPPQFTKKPAGPGKAYMSQIEDLLLYLLIWGEAANLRHTPECICFLFHKTMQSHQAANKHGGQLYPGYFLDHVVTPIYEVYAKAITSKGDHEGRKTYDDFNEFFWAPTCLRFEIVHNSRLDASSSFDPALTSLKEDAPLPVFLAQGLTTSPKTYVEKRSYFHGILTFHRVLEWHTLLFTLLIFLGLSNDLIWTTAYLLQSMSVIFIEINLFGIIWICLEVWLNYSSASFSNPTICSYLLRLLASYVLLVYQALYYSWSFEVGPQMPGSNPGAGSALAGADTRELGDTSFWW